MKSLVSGIFLLLFSFNSAIAQDRNIYKYVGAVGLGDIHWITNQNTYGSEHIKGKLTWGYGYGGKFGLDINNKHKIELGVVKSFFGQNRKTEIEGAEYQKKLKLTYLTIPLSYKFVLGDVSQFFRSDFQLFATTGLRFSNLLNVEMEYSIDDAPVDFYTFHTINNKHLDEINANPIVTDGKTLYYDWDIVWNASVGATYFFFDYMAVELAVEGGFSVLDMNRPEWQIKDNEGIYSSSKNAYIGLNLALIYYFPYW